LRLGNRALISNRQRDQDAGVASIGERSRKIFANAFA
jgi:hypothetical protein